ncbi:MULTISPECIES: YtrH family sporulation protein [unclassified Paenibacillus]|uniref:YtrH family sporulation protein n=1 Tax=unclassified Paenibacillus TaxID=185978 RepID=UPI00070A5102|nr:MULTISPECIES: YtrH family sporulation protein [unclassified Paenibacillus]KQX45897.1 sporulation protein [Paenibacillus sp. Root444D2]KRE50832.1 sporulation protein [Paenibacillus sp. Soil724D2]
MYVFWANIIVYFCIAFGVVFGGSMLSGIAAVLTLQSPTEKMLTISENIKIWAMVAAVGGTIDPIRYIESHVAIGHLNPAIKQIILIIVAFIGAQMGTSLIQMICKGGNQP